ncbi:MarR family winged helix-turn-helix transcriptional regulator [Opitutus terrae]|uniref:Transcriptional regulator, MarR family n=1 Tax=Opitutus terrae (strain DSM 11246 / JCM 15787 / PB90-1) TaxID=452637 RepID=B1ZP20_OPITP|nr:MarR family transcriptional regulator [Opitutus terrae]ACB77547.1 transcriptional regulator, MarR family [Opitutus terrae PB90-1]
MPADLDTAANHALHAFVKALKLLDLSEWSAQLAGIGMLDLGILHHAARDPNAILADIRQALGVPNSTLTSAIDRLERKGLLRRTINPRDKRSYGLALTDAGRALDKEHMRVDRAITRAVLAALDSDPERRTLVGLLEKVSRQMARR